MGITSKSELSNFKKTIKRNEPVQRDIEKMLDQSEYSPMDPPDAYKGKAEDVPQEELHDMLKQLIREHQSFIKAIDKFEQTINTFKESDYNLDQELNSSLSDFFRFFDDFILPHSKREEKHLFSLLNPKLLKSGEHGPGPDKITSVDLMEDDHVKLIQQVSLIFNLLGLAARLPDPKSRMLILDIIYHNSRELIEVLRLHIYREENIIFPLAHKLIPKEELDD